jgi:hypothetical protein
MNHLATLGAVGVGVVVPSVWYGFKFIINRMYQKTEVTPIEYFTKFGIVVKCPFSINVQDVKKFKPFNDWFDRAECDGSIVYESIEILNTYMFGKKIGFLFMNVTGFYVEGEVKKQIPGAVFLRGNSCAVLVWYRKNDEKYVVLINQFRMAANGYIWEVPAGMMDDDDNNAKGKMFDELYEETGIDVNKSKNKMVQVNTVYSSPGILDEQYHLFSIEIEEEEVKNMTICNKDDDEIITSVASFNVKSCPTDDVKLLALLNCIEN